jgi:hypothetical protein
MMLEALGERVLYREPKDVAAAYMRKRVSELPGAYAVLQVHEVWTARRPAAPDGGPPQTGPVKDLPGRQEAILVSLETKEWGRTLVIPFRREGGRENDPTAKVVAFGDVREGKGLTEGRFSGLLQEVQ